MTINSSQSQPFKEIFIKISAVESIAELVKIQLHISSFNAVISSSDKGFHIGNQSVNSYQHFLICCKCFVFVEVFICQRLLIRTVIITFDNAVLSNIMLGEFADRNTLKIR